MYILDLLLIVYVLAFVLALKLHMLMLVSPPVCFPDVLIFLLSFCSGDSFNERNAFLVAFQVL